MGLRDLFFSITARDKTGAAFSSVNKKLRETGGHAATASERIDRTGAAMRRAGAAGSVASAGIVALFRDSIGLYDEQARAEAKIAQAIRATGGAAGFTAEELAKQAQALQGVTRFGDERILNEVTAQLLTFKDIAGDSFTRAQTAALDLATVLDGDLQSASIMLGKALNDPAVGLSAMSRAGVTFTKDQQEVIKALAETGNIAEAQRLILDEIASAYGGQATAARTAGAGILDAWSNTWGDVKEVVGKNLLELLPPVIAVLERITGAFRDLEPGTQKTIVVMGALAVAVPPVTLALGLLASAAAAISAPVALTVAGIVGLTSAVVAFWPEIKAATEWVGEKFAAALQWASDAMSFMEDQSRALDAAIVNGLAAAMTVGAAKVQMIHDVFRDAFGAIPQIVGDVVNKVGEWINGKLNAILDNLGQKVEWVEGKFFWLYDKVVGNSWVPDMIEEIGKHFGYLQGNMVKPTDDATSKVSGSFEGLAGDVGSKIGDLASSGTLKWKTFMGSLLDVGKNYADRIVSDVFGKIGDGLTQSMSGLGGSGAGGSFLNSLGSSLFSGLGSAFSGLIPGLDQGGSLTVGGRAGVDRNFASVRLSQGEKVKVTRANSRDTSAAPVTVNIYAQDVNSFKASRAQVGQQIGRAVAAGQRGM
ncbi:hypothetical protein [Roseobacter weihaiensis]|uniref:hypothetical protein n=1 Tax=Roseobacter weihaiensis TaxID=2763262 RepID=UPI001D0B6A5D|nr:hypothetical protein [Roseobacter sp. H9]